MIYQCECGGALRPKLDAFGVATDEFECIICGSVYEYVYSLDNSSTTANEYTYREDYFIR